MKTLRQAQGKLPKVLVLKADGINRDEEMAYAFKVAGAYPQIVHINELRENKQSLENFQILALPGGFAYGDDIVSGKILAIELTSFLGAEMKKFIERKDTAIIGVCNGFQVLVRTGLLPFRKIGEMDVTLTNNDSGHFECRWVKVKVNKNNNSKFLKGMDEKILWLPIAHGEGKFFTDEKTLKEVEDNNLVAFRYMDNPNGSLNDIVGVTDSTGRILGMMPHPECFIRVEQHPNWRRGNIKVDGLPLFENIVDFVKNTK
ncbi:phosphoribosylformylglycinamidine synthase I [Candidatus Daviesbacteria bacterium RIFCSPLOWO2_02_FULL_36_7]|uniref:Phosphoribosylformylglycinamidine synthase I n=1 Tax=Candidatus Daviesbacteria bacterium RIFCSPLOWO2_02_FULL_36_7 TaxID=1797792 RepID=A0A1F5MFS2_9BACT|nr:MAG: phosphoribosylformylglycinamidine synthase I [Candidatus Daviesbacteria bacterium RIFCSPLOWO2_02_FULL_36_7]